ncbi:MAG TPA: CHASE2 domain-containing protein [Candidatus Binatia bacterium]|jgi:CHASE2 domain-containing sensor protein|nr:CHASE2 domain-containing protein [Candidatus Binatia bacterium]
MPENLHGSGPKKETALLEKESAPLWRHFLKAAPIIVFVSLLTFVLEHAGWLRCFETAALDTWLHLKAPLEARHVIIVGITEDDYRDLFRGRSPLDGEELQKILKGIAAGRPEVIGVDLDTSEVKLKIEETERPPIVWAREALLTEGKLEPLPVLGGKDSVPPSGIALLPQDSDGIIRRYQRVFHSGHSPVDSFPWAVVKAFCHTPNREAGHSESEVEEACRTLAEEGEGVEEPLVLNFSGDRYSFRRLSAADVVKVAASEGWQSQGPLKGKIVLLGGRYRAARDEYITPVGPMAGVELMAQAIESELQGGGIRPANEFLMLLLEIGVGILLVVLYHYCRLGTALLLSFTLFPVLALICSFLAFSSLGFWANFVPILTAVLIHQLYDHAKEYRRMYHELEERQIQHEGHGERTKPEV